MPDWDLESWGYVCKDSRNQSFQLLPDTTSDRILSGGQDPEKLEKTFHNEHSKIERGGDANRKSEKSLIVRFFGPWEKIPCTSEEDPRSQQVIAMPVPNQ